MANIQTKKPSWAERMTNFYHAPKEDADEAASQPQAEAKPEEQPQPVDLQTPQLEQPTRQFRYDPSLAYEDIQLRPENGAPRDYAELQQQAGATRFPNQEFFRNRKTYDYKEGALEQMYELLKKDGADVGSFNEFNNDMRYNTSIADQYMDRLSIITANPTLIAGKPQKTSEAPSVNVQSPVGHWYNRKDISAVDELVDESAKKLPERASAQSFTDKQVVYDRQMVDGKMVQRQYVVTKVNPNDPTDTRYIDPTTGKVVNIDYMTPDEENQILANEVKPNVSAALQAGDFKGAFDIMVDTLQHGRGAKNITNLTQAQAKDIFKKIVYDNSEDMLDNLMGDLDAELKKANDIRSAKANQMAAMHSMNMVDPVRGMSGYNPNSDPAVYNVEGGSLLDVVNNMEAKARERLTAMHLDKEEVDRMCEAYRARVINAIADKGTNAEIAKEMFDNPTWQNVAKGVMDVFGGVNDSMLGRIVNYEHNEFNRAIQDLTRQKDQQDMDMLTTALRGAVQFGTEIGTMEFVPFMEVGKDAAKLTGSLLLRGIKMSPKLSKLFAGVSVDSLVAAGMTNKAAVELFGRQFATSKAGAFLSDAVISTTHGSVMFGLHDVMRGYFDYASRAVLPAEMETDMRNAILMTMPEGTDPESVNLENIARFVGNGESMYTFLDASKYAWLNRGAEGAMMGLFFIGQPFGNLIGRNRTVGYKVAGDITKLFINAASTAAYTTAKEGQFEWDTYGKNFLQNVLSYALLDAHGAYKRYKNIENEMNAERFNRQMASWNADPQNNGVPSNKAIMDGLTNGVLVLPQPEQGKRDRTAPQAQLFERKKQEDGTPTPLTPQQQAIEEQFNGFLQNTAIPEVVRAQKYYMLTGKGWKLSNPARVGEVRAIAENDSYAVDLLNDEGNVIDTHYYKSMEEAQKGQQSLQHNLTVADMGDLIGDYIVTNTNNTFGNTITSEWDNSVSDKIKKYNFALQEMERKGKAALSERQREILDKGINENSTEEEVKAYNDARQEMERKGKEGLTARQKKLVEKGLSKHEKDMSTLFENPEVLVTINKKIASGEKLSEQETAVVEARNRLWAEHLKSNSDISALKTQFENDYGLEKGELDKLMKGHETEKEAKAVAEEEGSEVVKMGDKWYTTDEMQILRDYRQVFVDAKAKNAALEQQRSQEAATRILEEMEKAVAGMSDQQINNGNMMTAALQEGAQLSGQARTEAMQDAEYFRQKMAQAIGLTPEKIDQLLGLQAGQSGKDAMQNLERVFPNPNTQELARQYLIAREKSIGVLRALNAKMEAAAAEVDAQMQNITHKETNTVQRITTKKTGKTEDGQQLFVVSGKLNRLEDGSVTIEGSTGLILAADANGNLYKLSAGDIKSAESPVAAEEYAATAREMAERNAIAADEAEIEGKVAGNVGEQVDVVMNGERKNVQILQVNPDGTLVVSDGKANFPVTKEQLQGMHDAAVAQTIGERHAPKPVEMPAEAPKETMAEQPKAETTEAPAQPKPVEEKREPLAPVFDGDNIDTKANNPADVYDYYNGKGMTGFIDGELARAKEDLTAAEAIKVEGATAKEREAAYAEKTNRINEAKERVAFWESVKAEPERRAKEMTEAVTEAAPVEQAKEEEQTEEKTAQITFNEANVDEHNNRAKTEGGFVINGVAHEAGGEMATMLDSLGKALGTQIQVDINVPYNGKWSEGKGDNGLNLIIINPRIARLHGRTIDFVIGHEMTHGIKSVNSKGTWNAYVDAVKAAMGEEEFNRQIENVKELYTPVYKQSGQEFTEKDAIEEVCSDYAGEHITNDREFVKNLLDKVQQSGESSLSVAHRIKNYINKVVKALRSIADPTMAQRDELAAAEAAQEMWTKMFEYAAAKERENKEVQASITGGMELEEGGKKAPDKYSVTAMAEGAGFKAIEADENGNVAFEINGERYTGEKKVTKDVLRANTNSVLSYMMNDARKLGTITPEKEEQLWDRYASMLNAFLEKGLKKNGGYENLSGQWQWIAETIYKTVATNGDAQYSYSLDITRVCKKNEAVINSISALQTRLGYGISPAQVMDIYLETQQAGYQVPCPVCYVFSRYIRNGRYATIAINGQRKYGQYLKDPATMTDAEYKKAVDFWVKELEKQEAENKDKETAASITKAKQDITTALKQIDEIGEIIVKNKLKGAELQSFKIQPIEILDKRYRTAADVVAQASLTSWIKQFAIHQVKEDGKQVWKLYTAEEQGDLYNDGGFEDKYALDLRLTADVMRKYPAIQRLRKSGGAAAGKEITFVANNDLGEVPMMLGSMNTPNYYKMAVEATNAKERKAYLKKARERFTKAHIYAQQQSLRGGQRMWSWSDNIERIAPDVALNLMQLEMLGGALQSYSKQLEGIKLVASMNGYVNGSLMGRGIGYEEIPAENIRIVDGKEVTAEPITYFNSSKNKDIVSVEAGSPIYTFDGKKYALAFDDVTGIQAYDEMVDGKSYKGLFQLNNELDRAGNILVGMNDLHVLAAMNDPRVFFIIPWHSSGNSVHILDQMLGYLGVDLKNFNPQDFTEVQEEKRIKAKGEVSEDENEEEAGKPSVSEHLTKFWEDHKNETDFRCGIKGGVESGVGELSESQVHYRELRDAIFLGIKMDTGKVDKKGKPVMKYIPVEQANPKWFKEIMNDEFLSQAYRKVRGTVDTGVMTSGDCKYIYPYEYWDEASTFNTADVNGARYIEYCRRLGCKPKFCGKLNGKAEGDFGNFADQSGYWKLLIDRRMYDTKGKFQDLTPVDSKNFTPDLVDPEKTSQEFIVTRVADDEGVERIADATLQRENERVPEGVAKVNYDTNLKKAVKAYEASRRVVVEHNGKVVKGSVIEFGEKLSVSADLDEQHPDWRNQETKKGGHNTQITGTTKTYEKIGSHLILEGKKGMTVLDASSGKGLGTQALKKMGFDVEDVEPFQEDDRKNGKNGLLPATYSSYDDLKGKQYDVVLSNAVLNVIPDDWRAGVVAQMAEATKEGGKMIVNVRNVSEIKGIKNKIELDDETELLIPKGKNAEGQQTYAYQKFWSKEGFRDYMQEQLGDGWIVEIGSESNCGTNSGTVAVCYKKGGETPDPEGKNEKFSITGEKGADEERKKDLEVAEKMAGAGKDALVIKQATGWEKGADGKWRYEMSDLPYPDHESMPRTLGEAYPDGHELFDAYPQLMDIKLDYSKRTKSAGSFSNANQTITISKEIWNDEYAKNYLRSVIQHEVQHAIQHIEGFAVGTNVDTQKQKVLNDMASATAAAHRLFDGQPMTQIRIIGRKHMEEAIKYHIDKNDALAEYGKVFLKATEGMDDAEYYKFITAAKNMKSKVSKAAAKNYKNYAGEVESNNVEERLDWTPEKRRNTLLEETERVPRSKQIVEFGKVGNAEMGSNTRKKQQAFRNEIDGTKLTDNKLSLYKAFTGENYGFINVTRKGGRSVKVLLKKGDETNVGINHALNVHYPEAGKSARGYISAEELMMVDDVVRTGAENPKDNNRMEYSMQLEDGSTMFVVTRPVSGRKEIFINAYTDRESSPTSAKGKHVQNGTASVDELSENKGTNNSAENQENVNVSSTLTENSREVASGDSNQKPKTKMSLSPAEKQKKDEEYKKAIESGDEQKVSDMIAEAAREAGYISDSDYRISHRAPYKDKDGYHKSMDDVVGSYPEDVYDNNGWRIYGYGNQSNDYEAWRIMRSVRNNPDAKVKVYRAVSADVKENEIRNGDWVTPVRSYAEQHRSNIGGRTRIIEQEVRAGDLYTDGNDLSEWGYDDGKSYGYKNTKNNRKLLEPTYDDNGNLIPLSQRFNSRKSDVRYSIGGRMRQRRGESDAAFMQRQQDYINLAVKSPAEARQRVMDEIREQMNDQRMGAVGKRALNQLMKDVRDADDANIQNVIKEVNRTMNQLSDKALTREMDKLLRFQTYKKNGRNMSVAKSVDDATRKAFDFLRDRLVDFKATDYDDEKRALNSELSRLYRENKYLQQQHDNSTDPAEQQRLEQQIADNKDVIEQNREQLKDIEELIAAQRQANQPLNQQTVADMISDLTDRYNDSLTGNGVWTEDDAAQLTASHILNKRLRLNDFASELEKQKLERDRLGILLANAREAGNKQQEAMIKRDIQANIDMQDDILQQIVALKQEINDDLSGMIAGGKESLNNKMEAECTRKSGIILGFWGDIADGKYNDKVSQANMAENAELGKMAGLKRGYRGIVGTFDYMAQHMAKNTLGKDSWFYRYFMQSENGVMAAQENYMKGLFDTLSTMNAKAEEIWGKDYEKAIKDNEKPDSNHGITISVSADGMETRVSASQKINEEGISKGQATYLYMVWKMPDGKAKLEKMGFDEQSIAEAVEFIGDENKAWADWVQEEFLTGLREKYNQRYVEMYNTSMANIANYVPLRINKETRHQDVDVADMMGYQTLAQMSKKTGSLINRTHNLNEVDFAESAYSVISEHVKDMEEWYHMARVRQDLNYILSSTAIRNTLNANERASAEQLEKAAVIATGCYKSKEQGDMDAFISFLGKGFAAANIAFRNTTALKQMLSMPAFFGYSQDPKFIARLCANAGIQYGRHFTTFLGTAATMGWYGKHAMDSATSAEKTDKISEFALSDTMRWCIDNVPSFRQRVAKGSFGNIVMDEMLSGDKNEISRFKAKLGQYGMAANGLVDAVTCSIGIKSIYDYKYGKLKDEAQKDLNDGVITQEEYDQQLVEADRIARTEADIYYNGTQQSTHPAFLSPVQMDNSAASKMYTLYKNSPISYARKAILSAQDLWRLCNWSKLQENYAQQYMEANENLTQDKAMAMANKKLMNDGRRGVTELLLYSWVMGALWNWGGKGFLGLFQSEEDDDKKNVANKVAEEVSPILNGVPVVDLVVNTMAGQDIEGMLLYDAQERIANIMSKQQDEMSSAIALEVIDHATKAGLGVDLNALTNIYLGMEHLVVEGITPENRSKMLDIMFLLNTPNKNRKQVARKIYSQYEPQEFEDAIIRADKLLRESDSSWKQHLSGFKVLDEKKLNEIRKEYWTLRATDDEKAQLERKKANSTAEISKAYPNTYELQADFDKETDVVRKKAMGDVLLSRMSNPSRYTSTEDKYQQVHDKMYKDNSEKAEKDEYTKMCTSQDIAEDAAFKLNLKDAKKYLDEYKRLGYKRTPEGEAYYNEHQNEIKAGMKLETFQRTLSELKGYMRKAKDEAKKKELLGRIREIRSRALGQAYGAEE